MSRRSDMESQEKNASSTLLELHRQLKKLVHQIMGRKSGTISDAEVRDLFEGFFATILQFDAKKYEEQFRLSLGCVLSQPELYLLRRWNAVADQTRQLDAEVLLKPYKDVLRQTLVSMTSAVQQTRYLSTVFNSQWFADVRRLIEAYDGEGTFGTNIYTVFIGFLQERREGRDLIARLDTEYGAIARLTGQQRVRTLQKKLRNISRPLTDYLGTVFEILILGPCARTGWLKEYEPKVGTRHAEGLIVVDGTRLLLEATVMTAGREFDVVGNIRVEEEARKILKKISGKTQQLWEAKDPILLFLSPHWRMSEEGVNEGIVLAFRQQAYPLLAGVVVSDTYCAQHLRVAWNPFSSPLQPMVRDSLSKLYSLQSLDLNNLWSNG